MFPTCAVSTEEVKGEKDAGKEIKAPKEEAPKGNGKPPAERPRFMFNIADGGFTGQFWFVISSISTRAVSPMIDRFYSCFVFPMKSESHTGNLKKIWINWTHVISETVSCIYCICIPVYQIDKELNASFKNKI